MSSSVTRHTLMFRCPGCGRIRPGVVVVAESVRESPLVPFTVSAPCIPCGTTTSREFPTLEEFLKTSTPITTTPPGKPTPEMVERPEKPRCKYDTDGDGNCHIHPNGCP